MIQKLTILSFLCLVFPYAMQAVYADDIGVANNPVITIVVSGENREYQRVYMAIKEGIESIAAQQVILKPYLSANYNANHRQADLIVTIGSAAAEKVAVTGGSTPVLSTFLTKSSYDSIWKDKNRPVAGIVIDQPISRYASLLGQLLKKGNKVGVFSDKGNNDYKKLVPLLKRSGLSLTVEDVNGSLTAKNISRLLSSTDLILVIPDIKYISPQRAKWLLYMAYRNSKPVIAFTPSYVKAGALAAIFSTPDAIGEQVSTIISKLLGSTGKIAESVNRLESVIYPQNFSVVTNKQVAIHTGILIPDEKTLEKRIRSGEQHAN